MITTLLFLTAATALGMVRFHAKPDEKSGTPGLGPEKGPETPDAQDAQRRRHAAAARNTLLDKAAREAADESQRLGRTVLPKEVPSIEELMAGHTEDPATSAGPTPGAELRPGETLSGPAQGDLARQALYPEHQAKVTSPTVNAPGLGADSGLKKTADNPDARAGAFGHAEGVDPADPQFRGQGTAPERTDTPEQKAARQAAEADIEASLAKGEAPTREQLTAAGCPESELDRALEAGAQEAKVRAAGLSNAGGGDGNGGPAGTGGSTATSSSETADDLVANNTREQLAALAEKESVEVKSGDTKQTIAEAIVAKRKG